MKIKYYVALLILFFFSMMLFGCDPSSIGSTDYGSSQISGYAIDEISFSGVSDAAIITIPGIDTIKTDKNGYFNIQSYYLIQDPQEIQVQCSKDGYRTKTVTIRLVSDGKANVTIPMQQN
ncbi:MAG: hypothetical protein HY959_01465 [Ignavibacteriae bacterium]|nr:hypothetical protein [Ignavibacteriota bacterium]